MRDNFHKAQWAYDNLDPPADLPVVLDKDGNRYEVEFEGFRLRNMTTGIVCVVSDDDFFRLYEQE